ncbi:hypothetical protein [Chryseolinea serpens]|nr:hypothetical protein [Chryseolinea serpens]
MKPSKKLMQIFPTNFPDKYAVEGHTVQYSNFIEIVQGGPEVANLIIDGKMLGGKEDYFGGPPVFFKNYMFVPLLKKSFLRRYFKICVINLTHPSIAEIGDKEVLVLLSRVDETTVFFFEDLSNTKLKSIRWN